MQTFKKQHENKYLSKVWIVVLLVLLLVAETRAHICVPDTLAVVSLFGQVVSEQSIPFVGSIVELRADNLEQKLIAKVVVDDSGHFTFINIKPGKYVIYAIVPHFNSFAFPVKLRKLPKSYKVNVSENIIIVMGIEDSACGGCYAKYGAKRTN